MVGAPPSVHQIVIKPVPTILVNIMNSLNQQAIMTDPVWEGMVGGVSFVDFVDKSGR
jgi:hypothetical protein